jgi:hypothetical protein
MGARAQGGILQRVAMEVSGSVCEIVCELEIFARVFGCEFLFALVIEWVF